MESRTGSSTSTSFEDVTRRQSWKEVQFHAAPISYLVDGKQYIVLAVGGGADGAPERLIALALP